MRQKRKKGKKRFFEKKRANNFYLLWGAGVEAARA